MRPSLAIFLAVLLGAGAAMAQSSLAPPQAMGAPGSGNAEDSELRVQRQGDVSFISGGIGEEGRDAMHQAESGYNLRLLFARQSSGEYLADVGVTLTDGHGKNVLEATSDGPLFYAHVPPGHYKLNVAFAGKTQSRSISIAASGVVSQAFYWPKGQ